MEVQNIKKISVEESLEMWLRLAKLDLKISEFLYGIAADDQNLQMRNVNS